MDKRVYFREGLKPVETENTDKMIVRGYAVVFDELTDRVGFFKERILREALDGVDLSEVYLIVGHDFKNIIAKSGVNMRIEVDDVGLWFEAEFPDTQLARDTYELVKREILTGMSFGFYTREENIDTDYDNDIDTIKKIDSLYEITLTPIPAYPQTVATAVERKQKHEIEIRKQLEAAEIEEKLKTLEDI